MSELIQNINNLDWGLIMSTLLIRFVGVFFVLAVLMIGMIVLGKVVSALVSMQEAKGEDEQEHKSPAIALAEEPEREAGEEEVVAAIGAAIAMAMESDGKIVAPAVHTGVAAGLWAMTGRTTQMNMRLQGGSHRRP